MEDLFKDPAYVDLVSKLPELREKFYNASEIVQKQDFFKDNNVRAYQSFTGKNEEVKAKIGEQYEKFNAILEEKEKKFVEEKKNFDLLNSIAIAYVNMLRREEFEIDRLKSEVRLMNKLSGKFFTEMPEFLKADDGLKKIGKYFNYLEEWTDLRVDSILFDSDKVKGELKNEDFYNVFKNKMNLYVVCFDDLGNIFGSFIRETVQKIAENGRPNNYNYDPLGFLFTFNEFGKEDVCKRYMADKGSMCGGVLVYKDSDFLFNYAGGMGIAKPNVLKSWATSDFIQGQFNDAQEGCLNGRTGDQLFAVKRIVVLEMF